MFNGFRVIATDLESLIDIDYVNQTNLSKSNLIYLMNQRRRIIKRRDTFLLYYSFDPDEFDSRFLESFRRLSQEIIDNKISVVDLKGDYLFINGTLPVDSMLIPLRLVKLEKKKQQEEQINFL